MTKSRLLLAFFLLALAAPVAALLASLISYSVATVAVALLAGLALGLLSAKKVLPASRPKNNDQEPNAIGVEPIGFTPALLHATLNEMREGLLVIDQEMRVVASNRAARSLLSSSKKSSESRRLTELTRNPAIYDAFLDAVRGKERTGVKVETYGQGKRIFDLRVAPLRAANGQGSSGAVGVFFDVTKLERLELVRQEFLSNVSHELRTPLTSIVALAETLEEGAINDSENSRRFLSIIQKNAAQMRRLIDDILELSAIEAGNVKVNPELFQLRRLVDDIVSSLSALAAARGVALQNLVPPDAFVFADPHRLMQMLTNLIDNAIKFNRDEGAVSIKYESGERYRVHVEDTGEGIPEHHLDRLFERFYRVDRARSRQLGGTGLGLAIVKHLAHAHNGEVKVESRFGEGSRFTIELPHESISDERGIAQSQASAPIRNTSLRQS